MNEGVILDMNGINDEYVSILKDSDPYTFQWHHKKHLKKLISDHIADVKFVPAFRKNESDKLMISKSLSEAVANVPKDPNAIGGSLLEVANTLRTELIQSKNGW